MRSRRWKRALGEQSGSHLSVSELMADAAYFGARLALREGYPPVSRYQTAELKVFQVLNDEVIGVLRRLKRGGFETPRVADVDVEEVFYDVNA